MAAMEVSQFTELIRRHAGLIHKIAYAYCRNAPDREDVVQEITVQLWRARDRYDERYRQTTWIYRIALNVAISFYRRERRHRDHGVPIEAGAIVVAEPVELGRDRPVTAIQRAVERIKLVEYRATKWALLGGVVIWLPAVLILFEAVTGVAALARVDLGWLIANLGFGLAVLGLGQAWSKRYVERSDLGPRARRLVDAISGRSLRSVAMHLAELSTFERDEPSP